MNTRLWGLQIPLATFAGITGVIHFTVPPDLPAPLEWMYDLSTPLHYISGTAEILAALGLVLPGLTGIQTRLTPLAALGLVMVMIGAVVFHITRGEGLNIVVNVFIGAMAAVVAYGRWQISPLPDRSSHRKGQLS
ncbi:MAG: DoxX family protein [Chloroflexi bacterium]|nr:DoxX family protein [Chloroflexota bacterium]